MTKQKIICVGLNKTGTVSLHKAFEGLGIKSLHNSMIKDLTAGFMGGKIITYDKNMSVWKRILYPKTFKAT